MGQPKEKEKARFDTESDTDLEADSFEALLREIAHDTSILTNVAEAVSILPSPGEIINGKYRIDQRLDSGGMGAVYSATHLIMKRRVAIKWMLPAQSLKKAAVKRFMREAQAAACAEHPNVVDVYDFGRHKKGYFLVMELLRGIPLSSPLSTGHIFTPKEAISLLIPVMRGVAAAHSAGVIHRDLKPQNIFLCQGPDGSQREAKVLDFGISKLLDQQNPSDGFVTTDNRFLGTPSYIAPEQVGDDQEIDHRADIYSIGIILYQMLSGQLPFRAKSVNQMIIEISTGIPPPLTQYTPDIPPGLTDIVMKSISRRPEDRFPEVRAFASALEPFGNGVRFEHTATVPISSFASMDKPRPSQRKLWVTLGFGIALIVANLLWAAGRWDRLPDRQPTVTPPPSTTEKVVLQPPTPKGIPSVPQQSPEETRNPTQTQPLNTSPPEITAPLDVTSATKRPRKSKRTRRGGATKAPLYRKVAFINARRAAVKVSLNCQNNPIEEIDIPAGSQTYALLPNQKCRIINCESRDKPVFCPLTLRSYTDELHIN